MSGKKESYKSKASEKRHERREGPKERMKEYGQPKVGKVMGEYKRGTLHSGKGGPVVKSKKQAIAIALSEGKKAAKVKRTAPKKVVKRVTRGR